MSRRRAPDYDLALATLPAPERAPVLAWLDRLGMEPDEIGAVPPLRLLVGMMAAVVMVASMPGVDRATAFREAGDTLGMPNLLRSWYRWQDNAVTKCQTGRAA